MVTLVSHHTARYNLDILLLLRIGKCLDAVTNIFLRERGLSVNNFYFCPQNTILKFSVLIHAVNIHMDVQKSLVYVFFFFF